MRHIPPQNELCLRARARARAPSFERLCQLEVSPKHPDSYTHTHRLPALSAANCCFDTHHGCGERARSLGPLCLSVKFWADELMGKVWADASDSPKFVSQRLSHPFCPPLPCPPSATPSPTFQSFPHAFKAAEWKKPSFPSGIFHFNMNAGGPSLCVSVHACM